MIYHTWILYKNNFNIEIKREKTAPPTKPPSYPKATTIDQGRKFSFKMSENQGLKLTRQNVFILLLRMRDRRKMSRECNSIQTCIRRRSKAISYDVLKRKIVRIILFDDLIKLAHLISYFF